VRIPEEWTLTVPEQIELGMVAKRYQAGDRSPEVLKARERLILSQSKAVLAISKKFQVRSREDLVQIGYIGVIKAVERYDPEKYGGLGTFCSCKIRGEILDNINKQDRIISVGRSIVRKAYRDDPSLTHTERCVALNTISSIQTAFTESDNPGDGDKDITIPCNNPTPEQQAEKAELERKFWAAAYRLPNIYLSVITMRAAGCTHEEIGAIYNYSSSWSETIFKRAVNIIRSHCPELSKGI